MSASTHETAARTQFFGALFMSRTLSSSVLLQSMSPKTLLSAVSRGFWPNDVEFCDASRPFPTKVRGTAGRAYFSAPTHAGPQGERSKKVRGGSFWTAKMAFFARYRGPKTRSAPQENPPSETVRQKWSEIGLQNINCAPFFWTQTFFALFRTPGFLAKNKAAQNRPQTRNPQKRSVFAIFAPRPDRENPKKRAKRRAAREPEANRKTQFSPFLATDRPARKAKRHFFRQFSRPLETPIFVAFRPPRFASGSLAALRGLPRSHVFDRFRAPSHSNRIYIYAFHLFFRRKIGINWPL